MWPGGEGVGGEEGRKRGLDCYFSSSTAGVGGGSLCSSLLEHYLVELFDTNTRTFPTRTKTTQPSYIMLIGSLTTQQ